MALCSVLAASCSQPPVEPDTRPRPSTSPTPATRTDVGCNTATHFADGVAWASAKRAAEARGASVASLSVYTPAGSDYYAAIVRQPDKSIRSFILRPFTADCKSFTWQADAMPPGLYERLLLPLPTAP